MLPAQLNNVDESLLAQACAGRWPESITLEFKRDLPGSSDRDKAELCKDVAAMANADGGDIVYGVDEDAGAASVLVPINTEPADSAKRRVGQVLAGIEPRITGLQLQEVPIAGGYALVVRVPASFDGPHRYNGTKFPARTGTHTMDMTYDQLRDAFGRRATIDARVREFIADRRALLKRGETWADMRKEPASMVHLVPLSAFTGRGGLDMQRMEAQWTDLVFSGWGGGSSWHNLDGLLVAPADAPRLTYAQAFRNGAFECVRVARALAAPEENRWMSAGVVTKFYRDAFVKLTAVAKAQRVTGPAVFAISMHGVSQFTWMVSELFNAQHRAVADRSDLHLPELVIEHVEDVGDIDALLRPLFDVLWQCFDVDRCREYNAAGSWAPRP
ncbi:ATP-binding protein [Variovorax paradoxus]|nr:ATP-binding protein [Variovorax paradoxus]MBT2303804.1 ATP-binding protein [Variovorax paradoxus]